MSNTTSNAVVVKRGRPKLYDNGPKEGKKVCPECGKVESKQNMARHFAKNHPEVTRPLRKKTNIASSSIGTQLSSNNGNELQSTLNHTTEPISQICENTLDMTSVPTPELHHIPALATVKIWDTECKIVSWGEIDLKIRYSTTFVPLFVNEFIPSLNIPCVTPTIQEMKDKTLVEYVSFLLYNNKNYSNSSGLLKIIPPPEYIYHSNDKLQQLSGNIIIPKQQCFQYANDDAYKLMQSDYKAMTVADYRCLSQRWSNKPENVDVESCFWNEERMTTQSGMYGTDVGDSESLFDTDMWNIGKLTSVLQYAENKKGTPIPGITSSYFYYGSFGSGFSLHTEDMDCFSVSFLHEGDAKIWYTVNPAQNNDLELMLNKLYPIDFQKCKTAFRHKQFMFSPKLFRQHNLPYGKVTQNKGEFIITLPRGYHFGYNSGLNIAEAINFGTVEWLEESITNPPKVCDSVKCIYKCCCLDLNELRTKAQKDGYPGLTDDDNESDVDYGVKSNKSKARGKQSRLGLTNYRLK